MRIGGIAPVVDPVKPLAKEDVGIVQVAMLQAERDPKRIQLGEHLCDPRRQILQAMQLIGGEMIFIIANQFQRVVAQDLMQVTDERTRWQLGDASGSQLGLQTDDLNLHLSVAVQNDLPCGKVCAVRCGLPQCSPAVRQQAPTTRRIGSDERQSVLAEMCDQEP